MAKTVKKPVEKEAVVPIVESPAVSEVVVSEIIVSEASNAEGENLKPTEEAAEIPDPEELNNKPPKRDHVSDIQSVIDDLSSKQEKHPSENNLVAITYLEHGIKEILKSNDK